MIARRHSAEGTRSEALYSDCELYRYALTRIWSDEAPRLSFVMLNPSTADERRNDPTIARCEARARRAGYGGFRVVNLFAFRATDPRELRRAADPVGPGNDAALAEAVGWADALLLGWGRHGALAGRGELVARALRAAGGDLRCLGVNMDGSPRHPLYVGNAVEFSPFPETLSAV